jgi:hypothetical protein
MATRSRSRVDRRPHAARRLVKRAVRWRRSMTSRAAETAAIPSALHASVSTIVRFSRKGMGMRVRTRTVAYEGVGSQSPLFEYLGCDGLAATHALTQLRGLSPAKILDNGQMRSQHSRLG